LTVEVQPGCTAIFWIVACPSALTWIVTQAAEPTWLLKLNEPSRATGGSAGQRLAGAVAA